MEDDVYGKCIVSLFSFWYCTTILIFNFIHLQPVSDYSIALSSCSRDLPGARKYTFKYHYNASSVCGLQPHIDDAYYCLWNRPVKSVKIPAVSLCFLFMFRLLPDVMSSASPSHRHHPGGSLEYGEQCSITQILLLLVPWPSTGNSNLCFSVLILWFLFIRINLFIFCRQGPLGECLWCAAQRGVSRWAVLVTTVVLDHQHPSCDIVI